MNPPQTATFTYRMANGSSYFGPALLKLGDTIADATIQSLESVTIHGSDRVWLHAISPVTYSRTHKRSTIRPPTHYALYVDIFRLERDGPARFWLEAFIQQDPFHINTGNPWLTANIIKEIKPTMPTMPETVTYFLRRAQPTYPMIALVAPAGADFNFGIQVSKRGTPTFSFLPTAEITTTVALPKRLDLPKVTVLLDMALCAGYYVPHFQAEVYLVQQMVEAEVVRRKLDVTPTLERTFGRYAKTAALAIGGATIHERALAVTRTKEFGLRLLAAVAGTTGA